VARRNPAVLWRETVGGVVVLPPGAPAPSVLRGPAAAAWNGTAVDAGTVDSLIELGVLLPDG
jgi:hypothetical protein